MVGDSDAADLRKSIEDLRLQMVRVEEGQRYAHASLDRLNQSFGKHESEDKAMFMRHESLILGENGLSTRVGRIEDVIKAATTGSKWGWRIAAGGVILILGTMVVALAKLLELSAKIGGP